MCMWETCHKALHDHRTTRRHGRKKVSHSKVHFCVSQTHDQPINIGLCRCCFEWLTGCLTSTINHLLHCTATPRRVVSNLPFVRQRGELLKKSSPMTRRHFFVGCAPVWHGLPAVCVECVMWCSRANECKTFQTPIDLQRRRRDDDWWPPFESSFVDHHMIRWWASVSWMASAWPRWFVGISLSSGWKIMTKRRSTDRLVWYLNANRSVLLFTFHNFIDRQPALLAGDPV